MTLALFSLVAAVAVIGFAASCVLSARPRKVDMGSLDVNTPEFWRRIARHERAKDSWL